MKCTRIDWIGLTITYAILFFIGKRQTYAILGIKDLVLYIYIYIIRRFGLYLRTCQIMNMDGKAKTCIKHQR